MKYFMEKKMKKKNKLTKREQKFLQLMEIAGNVVIKEDLKLLKELAKY